MTPHQEAGPLPAMPDAATDAPAPKPEQRSRRMRKLLAIQERILALRARPPQECVAVRDPFGGWVMIPRPIAGK